MYCGAGAKFMLQTMAARRLERRADTTLYCRRVSELIPLARLLRAPVASRIVQSCDCQLGHEASVRFNVILD
jgi:hypothetical protein